MGVRYLLDTHILLWWSFDDSKLDANCRDIIRNPEHRIHGYEWRASAMQKTLILV
jgi:PIN domain nuclease of toxin-antitoxin system